jgi:hypothetical protein
MPCHLQAACYLAYPSIIQFNETVGSYGGISKLSTSERSSFFPLEDSMNPLVM